MSNFEHDVELELSASAMWEVLKDRDTILPKLMPEVIASIETIEGDGSSPGSIRLMKFGSMVPNGGHVKEKLIKLDVEGFGAITEEIEGGHLTQFGFTKWVQTVKLVPTGDNTSKVHVTAVSEGGSEEAIAKAAELTKQGLTHTFKALEKYAKGSA